MSKLDLPESTIEPSNLLVELQSIVTNRSFRTFADSEPVVYEFTQDPALLYQYYRLREAMYKVKHSKTFNIENYTLGEDSYDKISHILIARRGKLCIGGCRLIIREADELWKLPMESEEFNIRDLFLELPLYQVRHAEISRLTVMDGAGDGVLLGLYKAIYDKVTTSDIHYLFVKSPSNLARNWRFIANSFGVKTTKIVDGIHPIDKSLPSDIKWYLTLSDLSNFCSDDMAIRNNSKKFNNKILETLN